MLDGACAAVQNLPYAHPSRHDSSPHPAVPDDKGTQPLLADYHVRVLLPCYREDLELVQATVVAAMAAALPPGCKRTVYLCDDGRDPAKQVGF